MFMHALKLFALVASVAVVPQLVARVVPHDPKQDALLEQVAVPADYQVTFEDERGHSISFSAFSSKMRHRPFDIFKDPSHHKATLKLKSDEAIAQSRAARSRSAALPMQGHPFPAFNATTLQGEKVSLATLRGKPFVANFFFAQCAPCIAETPVLSQFHRDHPDVPVLAFTFDDEATAREYVLKRHFNWPVIAGQEALAQQAGVDVYPTLVLVDARGIVSQAAHSSSIAHADKPLTEVDLERWLGPGIR